MNLFTRSVLHYEVNFEKSKLEGDTCIEYIGLIVHTDCEVSGITVPSAHVKKLRKDIRQSSK